MDLALRGSRMRGLRSVIEALGWLFLRESVCTEDGQLKVQLAALYTDEEVDRSFEEFFEDVHTEFLKFGEIMNFKVCKNASSHLRGNVYVQYNSLESAVLAFESINGRYFAGKQLSCEYVNVTRWRVAICGEYMKSRLATCSRGSVCNFIHCFQNPGGDYEWADWDKPAPRYWLKKMASLFGRTDDNVTNEECLRQGSYRSRRSRSRGADSSRRKSHSDEDGDSRSSHRNGRRGACGQEASSIDLEIREEAIRSREYHRIKCRDGADLSYWSSEDEKSFGRINRNSRNRESDQRLTRQASIKRESCRRGESDRSLERTSTSSSRQKRHSESIYEHHYSSDINKFDRRNSPHAGRRDYKDSSHKKINLNSSDVDFAEDSLNRHKGRHRKRCKRSLQNKDEVELSDSSSHGSRLGGNEGRSTRNIKEIESKRESLGREQNNCLNQGGNCSRKMNISESVVHEVTIGRDCEMSQKSRRKSRSERQSDSTDSESSEGLLDGIKGRRHRSKKHGRRMKYEAELSGSASDGDRLRKHEKKPPRDGQRTKRNGPELEFVDSASHRDSQDRDEAGCWSSKKHHRQSKHESESADDASDGGWKKSQKRRRMRSRSKNEPDFFDAERDREKLNGEERQHRHGRGSTKGHTSQSASLEVDVSAGKHPDDSDRPEEKEETAASTCGAADTELEQAYRLAALKKLEEMRKCKEETLTDSKELEKNEEVHGHESRVIEDAEGSKRPKRFSGSEAAETSAVSVSRRRI